ncbi:MAG: hypothetical protein FWC32_06395 [Firmicutes bacterium]|nr:hypothetical protein [Bacillota bacterium]
MKCLKHKKAISGFVAVVIVFVFTFGMAMPIFAASPTNFTYTYCFRGLPNPSPDVYRVTAFILGEHLGIGDFNNPQDLFVIDNFIYVVDTGNNRIVVLEYTEDSTHVVYQVVDHVMLDGSPSTFNSPHGIFVAAWGDIWIADTENHRILHVDSEWNVIREITHPENSLLDPGLHFIPNKLGVDHSGRLFVQATHVNRGLMEFDRYGNFAGYMGASPVTISPIDQFWRMIATQEQRARMPLYTPTEYNNVFIDQEGFIFVTNSNLQVDPVRRLNAMGNDILIRNGRFSIVGDLTYGTAAGITGPSRFIDITTLPNETFVAFDRTRGRLFAYDFQGDLLFVFGGRGNREGMFILPSAVDSMGFALYALDAQTAAVTRFDLTEYGTLINQAILYYRQGLYDASAESWQQVLRMNGNFGMAYAGIARSLLRQGYYRDAMRYFQLNDDFRGYGRAFGFYRRQWMEDHFWIFAIVIGTLIVVPPVVKFVLRIRREVLES